MNYNYIAPYYDFLSRLCFLNRQQNAHKIILKHLNSNDKILWLGGGSGWFLPEIERLGVKLSIDYVEVSSVMIEKAKKYNCNNISIKFILDDILNFKSNQSYDVVITAFIFDHFKRKDCELIFNRFNLNLRDKGKWFYIDFCEDQNVFQRFLTRSMVLFFSIIAGIKTKDFPEIEYLFDEFKLIDQQHLFAKYIQANVYQK